MPTIDHDVRAQIGPEAGSQRTVARGTAEGAPAFRSILFPGTRTVTGGARTADEVLHDLALDQVFARIEKKAPAAADAFRTLCADEDEVRYRQEVFTALADPGLRRLVDEFLAGIDSADRADAGAAGSRDAYGGQLWHLEAVLRYTGAVVALDDGLRACTALGGCRGLRALAAHVAQLRASGEFTTLLERARACRRDLDALAYTVLVRGARVTVAPTDGEADLREAVLGTFARFRGASAAEPFDSPRSHGLDHVQAWVLEQVARVHPAPFDRAVAFARDTATYRDPIVGRFVTEVWFYLACLDALRPLRAAGLPVCLPEVSEASCELDARGVYDFALATMLVADGAPVVRNDLRLAGPERILVISGPNQGGKSTAARTFGQLHHLAGIGCPVPGEHVRIMLCDQVLTAFEREEQLDDLQGRLGAEIDRMHDMLARTTGRTALVLNEVFSSTALADARTLTRDVLRRILDAGAVAVCVTFIDELSRIDERTVSMVSAVRPDDPAVRTFRVERRVADGRAYARALATAHGLTARQIRDRLAAATGKEQGR